MAELIPGDLVLGRNGPTRIVANQHKAVDTIAEMLTFVTADDLSVSMTRDHALFINGKLAAAAEAKVGATLTTGDGKTTTIKRITKGAATVINAVTADGTIVADGILAASNPLWIAAYIIDAPITRFAVNVVLFAAGDVDSIGAGFGHLLAKIAAVIAVTAATKKLIPLTNSKLNHA